MVRDGYIYGLSLLAVAGVLAWATGTWVWSIVPVLLAAFYLWFFRDPERPGGVTVEIAGRLNALLGEKAYPNRVKGVWGKIVGGSATNPHCICSQSDHQSRAMLMRRLRQLKLVRQRKCPALRKFMSCMSACLTGHPVRTCSHCPPWDFS